MRKSSISISHSAMIIQLKTSNTAYPTHFHIHHPHGPLLLDTPWAAYCIFRCEHQTIIEWNPTNLAHSFPSHSSMRYTLLSQLFDSFLTVLHLHIGTAQASAFEYKLEGKDLAITKATSTRNNRFISFLIRASTVCTVTAGSETVYTCINTELFFARL